MKAIFKISALMSAVVLAGCVAPPQEPAPAPAPAAVQVECGVASPPGCREPAVAAVYTDWAAKMKAETQAADELRQRAGSATAIDV